MGGDVVTTHSKLYQTCGTYSSVCMQLICQVCCQSNKFVVCCNFLKLFGLRAESSKTSRVIVNFVIKLILISKIYTIHVNGYIFELC